MFVVLRRPASVCLALLLIAGPAAAEREPTTPAGKLKRARELAASVDELLNQAPPAFDKAEAAAASVLDFRRNAGLKPPHAELGAGYLLLARVHERRAGGRPRLDHLDPTLAVLERAVGALDAKNPAHLRLLAQAHQARGRVLRTAWRDEEAWQAFAAAVPLLARDPDIVQAGLQEALEMALEAFDRAPATTIARSARRALAPHARALAARVPGPQPQLLLGACLAGSRVDKAETTTALRRAEAQHLNAGDKRRGGWTAMRLARHHWHCGDLKTCRAVYEKARATLLAPGEEFPSSAYASGIEQWAWSTKWWFADLDQGKKPDWLLRDDLPRLLVLEGRVAEAWWALKAEFFLDLVATRTESARAGPPRALAEALQLEGIVRATLGDLEGAVRPIGEAARIWTLDRKDMLGRSRVLLDLAILEHLRGRAHEAATALTEAAVGLEAHHGLVHAETVSALALLAVVRVRSGDIAGGNALADRLITELRANEALRAWLAERRNVNYAGDLARAGFYLCNSLGRRADAAFLVQHFDPRAETIFSQGMLSPIRQLRDEGRYAELVERLRHPNYHLLSHDVQGGATQLIDDVPRFLGTLSAIRRSEALLDIGCYEEAFAASLDAGDGLSAMLPNEYLWAPFLAADLRASTLLARVLLERGLAQEALAVGRRAHRLQALIPRWLHLHTSDIETIWSEVQAARSVPTWRRAELRRWEALSAARGTEVLARALEATAAPDEALAMFDEAIAHVRTHLGPAHIRLGELLHARAGAAFRLGRIAEARGDAEAALAIVRTVLGEQHPAVADVLLSLADLDLAEHEHARAREGFEAVQAIADQALEPMHMHHVRARSGRALTLAGEGRTNEALAPMRDALERVVRRVREAGVGATQPQRLALLAATHWIVANWLEVTRKAGVDGYAEVLRIRGLAGRMRSADERAWRLGPEKTRADHEKLRSLQRRLARLSRLFGGTSWQRLSWRREVATLQAACDRLTRRMTQASSAYRKERKAREATAKRLTDRLHKSEALVDVVEAGGRYVAWILTKSSPTLRLELGTSGPIEQRIEAFRDVILDNRSTEAEVRVEGERARALVWAPIAAALPEGTTTVFLVPGGDYAALPLAAVAGATPGSVVAEEVLLAYLSTPHDLLRRPNPGKKGKGFLTVGDVDYNEAERAVKGRPVARTGRRLVGLQHGLMGSPAQPLPSSGAEAAWVRKALKAAKRVPGNGLHLAGAQATESNVRAAVPGKAVIHLATHAVVREGANARLHVPHGDRYRLQPGLEIHAHRFDPLLMSGVLLSGVNLRVTEGEDDGLLTALEATHLDLDSAQLVVLSACDSAQGMQQAAEGTMGLVRGFQLAGARTVVGSLWKVGDEPTDAFMRDFYARWGASGSVSAAQALRAASLAMRRGELGKAGREACNWAAFVAYGPLRRN